MPEKIIDNLGAEFSEPKSMREQVLKEIEYFRVKHAKDPDLDPRQYKSDYFSGFCYKILWQRERAEDVGLLDNPSPGDESLGSTVKNQTYRQFYDDIETTMKEMKLDREELRKLEQECRLSSEKDFNPLIDKVLDLFIRLREKGYNNRDLC